MKHLWLPILWSRLSVIATTPVELRREGRWVVSRLFQRTPSSPSGFTEDSNPFVFRAGEAA
jgi:hypothetical protein